MAVSVFWEDTWEIGHTHKSFVAPKTWPRSSEEKYWKSLPEGVAFLVDQDNYVNSSPLRELAEKGYVFIAQHDEGGEYDAARLVSDGKTLSEVDAMVHDAMKRELFYVAASRGRESVTVVTSDRELLRESVARSGGSAICIRVGAQGAAANFPARRSTPPIGRLAGSPAKLAIQSERLEQRVVATRELNHEVTRTVPAREYRTERKLERGRYDIGR